MSKNGYEFINLKVHKYHTICHACIIYQFIEIPIQFNELCKTGVLRIHIMSYSWYSGMVCTKTGRYQYESEIGLIFLNQTRF